MFLKTLTLKGFKSFADTTALELEPGVTVVVGPNGSGKSNVVDAIGWVLGAQAPSAVRSQKMDDVIFAGTSKRPALGRAEVGAHDRQLGRAPADRVHRGHDHPHAVPHRRQRVRHQRRALPAARHPGAAVATRGVGRQQHVIVSQGQIDAVLNARPEDRRLIIEEAAGVLKYRRRKEKAERRLAATEGNLTRLGDLLREVRRQLRPLERQADAARRHGDVVAELRALQLFLAGRELTTLRRRLADGGAAPRRAGHRGEPPAQDAGRARHRACSRPRPSSAPSAATTSATRSCASSRSARRPAAWRPCSPSAAAGIDRERGAFVDQAVIATPRGRGRPARPPSWPRPTRRPRRWPPRPRSWPGPRQRSPTPAPPSSSEWAEGVPAPTGRAAEVRGELAALRAGVERGEGELAALAGPPRRARREARAAGRRGRSSAGRGWRPPRPPRVPLVERLDGRRAGAGPTPRRRWPTPRRRCGRPTPSATRGRPAPRRWPSPSTRPGPAPAPSASPPCRRRARHPARPGRDRRRAGRPPSRPPPARRWPPSSSTASTPLAPPSRPSTTVARRHRRRGARPRRPPARAALHRPSVSRSAATCDRRRPDVERCSTRCSARRSSVDGGWAAAVDAALAHPDADRGHPRAATASASPAGGSAPHPPGPPARPSRRPAQRADAATDAGQPRRVQPARRPLPARRGPPERGRALPPARRARRPAHRGHRRPPARRGRPPRRHHRGRRAPRSTRTSWPSGSPASRRGSPSSS